MKVTLDLPDTSRGLSVTVLYEGTNPMAPGMIMITTGYSSQDLFDGSELPVVKEILDKKGDLEVMGD